MSGLSEQLAETVETVGPSVFRVEGRRIASAIAWSSDLLVTVASAVAGQAEVQLRGVDGAARKAAVIGWDLASDLAVLRVEGDALQVPNWTEGESLKVGNITLVLGRPNLRVEAVWGLVRDLDGAWQSETGAQVGRWIEIDGSLPRGFPGGPLLTVAGEVLGVNSRHLSHGGGTLPTADVRRVVDSLLTGRQPRAGYLGAAVHPVELDGGGTGLMILKVEPEGPAANAGLRQGDVLLQLGELQTDHPERLLRWLADGKGGVEVLTRYQRGGEVKETTTKLGERPAQRSCR